MPWLLNEDAALKSKLQGLQVFDKNAPNGRNVPVRFRLPETEIADVTYPIIIIEHRGWSVANDREHRGYVNLPYAPENFSPWWADTGPATTVFNPSDSPYQSYFPLPYNFDYLVTFYGRIMHEHNIPIIAQLAAYNRLNAKFGFLDVPQDGTKRTMQILGGPEPHDAYDENGKRLFATSYLIRIFSELISEIALPVLNNLVNQIQLNLNVYSDPSDLTGPQLAESVGILSVGTIASWDNLS
jgi:hypothetical protein